MPSSYFQATAGTVFETSLLKRFEVQALHSHTGWETYCEEYVAITGAAEVTHDSMRKSLAHTWLTWTLLEWRCELQLPPIAMALESHEDLDATLVEAVGGEGAASVATLQKAEKCARVAKAAADGAAAAAEDVAASGWGEAAVAKAAEDAKAAAASAAVARATADAARASAADALAAASDKSSSLLFRFIDKWGRQHAMHCRRPLPGQPTCMCYIVDGHMKCKRLVCENANARMIDMGALGTAVLGCTGTPLPSSRFCRRCRPFCAQRTPGPRPAGSQGTSTADFGVSPCVPCDEGEEEAPSGVLDAPVAAADAEAAAEAAAPLQPGEANVHLVEDLVGQRALTKANARKGHARCVSRGRVQYHVKWADYPSDANTWECECDISPDLVEAYKEAQAERAVENADGPPSKRTRGQKKKHVGATAAAVRRTSPRPAALACRAACV